MDDCESRRIQGRASGTASGQLRPRFKLVYFTVVVLTSLALAVSVLLALVGGDSDQIRSVTATCATTYKVGFCAIVALMSRRWVQD